GSFAVAAFLFQAADGIRAGHVTGVQTCALPISSTTIPVNFSEPRRGLITTTSHTPAVGIRGSLRRSTKAAVSCLVEVLTSGMKEIGRASCRKECRIRLTVN